MEKKRHLYLVRTPVELTLITNNNCECCLQTPAECICREVDAFFESVKDVPINNID